MANLYNVPVENGVQLTLQNALLTGATSTITFTASVASKLQASATIPGILVIDRVDANGNETPTKTEYISFTGVSGSTVTGLTRGLANSTDQDHSAGAIVEFVPDVVWADAINDVITTEHEADGTHKLNTFSNLNAPEGFLINGKIVPSVASNNLTVAIKGLDGNDPSATNPVYVRIDGVIRTITSALSITTGAGFNAFNTGSAEFAGIGTDYFVYLFVKASDSTIQVGISRIPYGALYSDFSSTISNSKYVSTTSGLASTDSCVNIGRFAAIQSASPSHNWSVPTFNSANLIQRPIFETQLSDFVPTTYGGSGSAGSFATSQNFGRYIITGRMVNVVIKITLTNKGSWGGSVITNIPFPPSGSYPVEFTMFGYVASNNSNPITLSKGTPNISEDTSYITYLAAVDTGVLTWGVVANTDTIRVNGSYSL